MADYCTTAEVKTNLGISGSGDDALIGTLVTAASRWMDAYCNRTLYADSDTTHYFDAISDVRGRDLILDDDLAAVTAVTNDEGTSVNSSDYTLVPRNSGPYHTIRLTREATIDWTYTTNAEDAITVEGKWGMTSSTSDARYTVINQAAIQLTSYLYRVKDTGLMDAVGLVDNGMMQVPKGFPATVRIMIAPYRRYAAP